MDEMNETAIPSQVPAERRGADDLVMWASAYFRLEASTGRKSIKEARRDVGLFLSFMEREERSLERPRWTPRLSRAFVDHLQGVLTEDGARRWSNRTINRVIAHLKTWSKWIHRMAPFPLGDPMEKIQSLPVSSTLEIERAITPAERRRILDAADRLLLVGGRSRNRRLGSDLSARPVRKGFRPYRDRAIIYTLIETGMRRAAVCRLNLAGVDLEKRLLSVQEKGGNFHAYRISREGVQAIRDYLEHERPHDDGKWRSPALFLPSSTVARSSGRLNPRMINYIWNRICRDAGVEGKTPHSARHAVGKWIMEKTGNVAAVQKQLGHKNAVYSMEYARITSEELLEVLDQRR